MLKFEILFETFKSVFEAVNGRVKKREYMIIIKFKNYLKSKDVVSLFLNPLYSILQIYV